VILETVIFFALLRGRLSVDRPGKIQHTLELTYEFIHAQAEEVVGHDSGKYVPFFGTIFIFILFMNLIGLIPGFGDLASAAVGGWVIIEAARFRLPRLVLARMVVNTLLGLGMQSLAEAIALGETAGISQEALLDVLGQTAVLTTGQKSKLANVKREQYPTQFALSLIHKDLRLVLSEADEVSVSMPATAAAQQMYTAAMAKGMDEDFSIMIKFMEQLASVSE